MSEVTAETAQKLCAKEKGYHKKACMQFFMAATGKEGLRQSIETTKKGMAAEKKKKKKKDPKDALKIK